MTLTKELENLFSELNSNPHLYLSLVKRGQLENVQAGIDWLEGNRLVFRSNLKGSQDTSAIDLLVKSTKALLDKHLGHFNWVENIGENPGGTAEAWSREGYTDELYIDQLWTQVGLAVKVGENCRLALI